MVGWAQEATLDGLRSAQGFLQAQYTYAENQPPVLRGYQATNRVTVIIDDGPSPGRHLYVWIDRRDLAAQVGEFSDALWRALWLARRTEGSTDQLMPAATRAVVADMLYTVVTALLGAQWTPSSPATARVRGVAPCDSSPPLSGMVHRGSRRLREGEPVRPRLSVAHGLCYWPGGRVLVGAAALVLIGIGAYHVRKAVTSSFLKEIDTAQASAGQRRLIERLGQVGYPAKGVALAVVGALA